MPQYEYRCPRCGFRLVVSMTFDQKDSYESWCEECGHKLTQVFNHIGVVFKGSGFYSIDSRLAPPNSKSKKDKKKKKAKSSD